MFVAILFLFIFVLPAEGSMGTIENSVYQCPGGQALNPERWWTEPFPHAQMADRYFLCGGNAPAGEGAGKASDACAFVDVDTCRVVPTRIPMTTARQALQPVCLSPARCYLFGGNTADTSDANLSVDLFDSFRGRVRQRVALLPEPRMASAAAPLGDGTILITGGYGVKDPVTKMGPVHQTAVRFDPRRKSFVTIPMQHRRGGHSITRLPDGTYLVLGGNGDDPSGAEIFHHATNTFTPVEAKMKAGRKDHRAVLAGDGRVYIIGGTSGQAAPMAIEVYDPATRLFSDTGMAIQQGREDAAVAFIPELQVIVAVGGEVKGAKGEPESRAIDVIDLRNRRVLSGTLTTPRDEPSLIVRRVDPERRTIELLVLTGQRKQGGREVSLPTEIVKIAL